MNDHPNSLASNNSHKNRTGGRSLASKVGWASVIACVLLAGTLVVAPGVRASVASWFGWYSHNVVTPGDLAGGNTAPVGDGGVRYDREPVGDLAARIVTTSLEEARGFLGRGVVLPLALEGQEMLLYRVDDKNGNLEMIGVSCVEVGFWARYRPAGDHKVGVTYGSNFTVTTENLVIGGRSALAVSVSQTSGKIGPAEIWMQDGNWVYELRDNMGDMATLVKIAESMK
jgi:hypothetical protein